MIRPKIKWQKDKARDINPLSNWLVFSYPINVFHRRPYGPPSRSTWTQLLLEGDPC